MSLRKASAVALAVVISLAVASPAFAGEITPTVDCEGSAASYRAAGIPCDCRGGRIVCDQPGGNSSGGGSSSGGGRKSHKTSNDTLILQGLQSTIDQMFTPNPETVRKIDRTRAEGAIAQQESEQAQQMTEEQRRQKAARDAEVAHLQKLKDVAGSLQGMPGGTGADVDLRPAGTSFFGLGGGTGTPPPSPAFNDPMVVDLRHLRRASYLVQEVETSTTDKVPALLDKALGAATGEIPDLPPGAVAPPLDESGLRKFRNAYAGYAGARAALARSEAALKEAMARKKAGDGPEAEAALEKARSAYEVAKDKACGSREEAVRVLRALGSGRDPDRFRPPVPSLPAMREETWLEMQKRMMEERAAGEALTKRTQKELASVVPPPKGAFRKVHEGVVLGFGTDDNDAKRIEKDGVSCFGNGKSYANMSSVVVSFGTEKGENGEKKGIGYALTESGRIVGDHLLDGAVSLKTPQAREALARISGAEFDRLVAHSNGATVAEALIRDDRIRVNELNVVGGDASLVKRGDYQELVDSGKVKRVVVWVNLNDPVPWGTSIAPLEFIKSGNGAVESMARKIAGAPAGGVEYRYMWGEDYRNASSAAGLSGKAEALFAPHFVESSYFPGIAKELGVDGYRIPERVLVGK